MAIKIKDWVALSKIPLGQNKNAYSLIKQFGQVAFDELVTAGHFERVNDARLSDDGGRFVRTKASVNAYLVFDTLPADGSQSLGAVTGREKTGLSARQYETAVQLLLATGEVRRAKGPNSIRRIADVHLESQRGGVSQERDLYEPFRVAISDYMSDSLQTYLSASTTATARGHRRQSGQWSRPDVTVIIVRQFSMLPQVDVAVHAFEIKPYSASGDLAGVYEAAAHQRSAHYATLVIEFPLDDVLPNEVEDECRRHGVGLCRIWGSEISFEMHPERRSPEPQLMDSLIKAATNETSAEATYLAAIGRVTQEQRRLQTN